MRSPDVYRVLLRCYPAAFRQEYGREMVGAFADQLRDARCAAGTLAAAAVWAGTLVDLVPTAFREHRHVITQDLRYAIRLLAGNPGFALVAVLSLALGIGANTAIFSLLNSVLLQQLPVKNPQELVMLSDPDSSGSFIGSQDGERSLLTYPEFRALEDRTISFQSVMASDSGQKQVQARIGNGEAEPIKVRMVSASYFATLGVGAAVGRTFDATHEPAEGSAPYAVISNEFWKRRFGGDPEVPGRTIVLKSGVLTVIGVAPAGFFGDSVGDRPDAWVPAAMQAWVLPGREWLHDRPGSYEKVMWLRVFGRLRPGVTRERAQADANTVFQQGLSAYYSSIGDEATRKRFLDQRLVAREAATGASSLRGNFAEPLLVLLAASALVLLIACSNLGNLMLARTTARHREMSVRLALGASRGRVVRQLLTESLCVAALGGLAGLAATYLLRQGLLRLVSDDIALNAPFDLRVVGFVLGLTAAAGLLLGLLPALRITKTDAAAGLRDQGRGIAGSAAWLRVGRLVVIGQLALSLPLLVGAGLLVRTLMNLQRIDLGYPKDDVLTLRIDAQPSGYDADRQVLAFERILDRVRALPSVRKATYSNNGLFGGGDNGDEIEVEGYTSKGDNDRGSRYDQIGPRYFSTLGIPVVLGREITEQDRPGGRMVCVINATFAKEFFNGRNPVGLHVTQRYGEERHTYEVVGVVADSRQNSLRGEIEHRFYTPATQPAATLNGVAFLVRPRGDVAATLGEMRRVIQEVEPNMPIVFAGTVAEGVDRRIVQDRLLARLSIAFGVVAALLVAIGLYGVLSYGVTRRTAEIGLRKALGAEQGTLIAMILRETSWLLLAGTAAGVALSAASLRLVTSRLYGLSSWDPGTFVTAMIGLTVVAFLAAWLPAYRASRVDPLTALRCE